MFDCNDYFSALTARVGNLRTLNDSPNPAGGFLSPLSRGQLYVEAKDDETHRKTALEKCKFQQKDLSLLIIANKA